MKRPNLKKLNEVEGKGKYRVEVSNRFASTEDFDTEVDNAGAGKLLEKVSKFQPKRF
jgi:hypothetical protein